MKKAIEAVAMQKKSLRQAAREYGVKSTTVENVEHGMKKMELWIGCDGGCEGWYHVICVGIDEENLPEDFCCDQCSH